MIIDLRNIDNDPFEGKNYDICICGAGVAGITLALNLSDKLSIALLEAGGESKTTDSQNIYKGINEGNDHIPLHSSRIRCLGGTSNVWGGWCRTLDKYDFYEKPFIANTGWPINKEALDLYLKDAKKVLGLSDNIKTSEEADTPFNISDNRDNFKEIDFSWSNEINYIKNKPYIPVNFKSKYKNALIKSNNIDCFLNANVVNINLYDNNETVKYYTIKDYSDKKYFIDAKYFVLAAGGIENARILLYSNKQIKVGIGNTNDMAGRFFQEHPHCTIGHIKLNDHIKEYYKIKQKKFIYRYWNYFAPTENSIIKDGTLNYGLRLIPNNNLNNNSFKGWLKDLLCSSSALLNIAEKLTGSKIQCDHQLDGIIHIASEQAPSHNNRISLDSTYDRFGNNVTKINWNIKEIDRYTIKKSILKFGKLFAINNYGRVRIVDWLMNDLINYDISSNTTAWGHHMGTTRMANSPLDGVVNTNQKVFGTKNLYIAGSSVFPTGGHANPTLTIVQMTLRLAHYLNTITKKDS